MPPYSGCQTCKTRRVKCDRTKPTCNQCKKSRRFCLESSAVQEVSFTITSENSYASGEVKRPRGPRSNLTTLRPKFDLQTRALMFYLQYHLQELKDVPRILRGLSECVSVWRVSGRTCNMVDLALSSMALAVYSRSQKDSPAAKEASSSYNRLLVLAQERIARLGSSAWDRDDIDACLLSAALMNRYEVAVQCGGQIDLNSPHTMISLPTRSHYDGAMAILKIWNDNHRQHAPSFIITQTRRELNKCSLLRNISLPSWILNGEEFGEESPQLDYDRIFVQIVNLQHLCSCLDPMQALDVAHAELLNKEAAKVHEELQRWGSNTLGKSNPLPHILEFTKLEPERKRQFYSPLVYSYPKLVDGGSWSQYFAIRMLLNSVRLRILELCPAEDLVTHSTYHEQRRGCTEALEVAGAGLAASIPYCLESFQVKSSSQSGKGKTTIPSISEEIKPYMAHLVLWPLAIAASIRGVNHELQAWFRSQLTRLGRISGDGVLECAEFRKVT